MSLVIDDAHVGAVKQYLMEQCDNIDYIVSWYVKTMNSVIEEGIQKGTTADALKEFLLQVESDINSDSATPDLMKDQIERFCTNFIKRVDKADKELY